jgi:hypothetical protein
MSGKGAPTGATWEHMSESDFELDWSGNSSHVFPIRPCRNFLAYDILLGNNPTKICCPRGLDGSIPFLQDLVVAIDCTCSFSHHWGRIWGVVLPFGRQQKYVLLPVSMSERAGASTACTASTQSLTPAVQSAPREVPIYEFDPSTSMQNYTSEIHRWLHRVATRPRRNVLLAYQFSGEGLTSAKQAWY